VRIVSALNVLGDMNTGEDFGTVCYLKIHQNLVFKVHSNEISDRWNSSKTKNYLVFYLTNHCFVK
jgi:hypothetical protein